MRPIPLDAHDALPLRDLEQDELRELIDQAPDPEVIVDTRGRIVFVSLQVEKVLGYSKLDLMGKPIHMLIPARYHAAHSGHLREYFDDASTRRVGPGVDLWALTKSGQEIPVEISLSAIGDGDERLVVASVRDVSVQRQVVVETQNLNEALSRKTIELEALVQDLRVFAQTASHDLQAPLRQISQFLMLLERRCGDALTPDGREYIQCAVESAKRLSGMVENVLEYSRIGASDHLFQPVDLSTLLEGVVSTVHMLVEEAGASITHDPLPLVLADETQVAALLQNLITNALVHRGESPPVIHVSARADGERWVISVRDNGVGIVAEHHARIFEMFQRSVAAAPRPGTGVGLAICKRVIDRHHGRIWVESKLGEGATFWFTLPAVLTPEGPAEFLDVRTPAAA